MKSKKIKKFSNYELLKYSRSTIQGGSGTVTVLDTDMESVTKGFTATDDLAKWRKNN